MRWVPPLRVTIPAMLLAVGCAQLGISHVRERARADASVESSLGAHAAVLAAMQASGIEEALRRGAMLEARTMIENVSIDRDLAAAALIGPDGAIMVSSEFTLEGRPLDRSVLASARPLVARAIETRTALSGIVDDRTAFVAVVPVAVGVAAPPQWLRPSGALVLRFDLMRQKRAAYAAARDFTATTAALLAAGCVLAWLALRRLVTRRASRLVYAAHEVAEGRFPTRVRLGDGDELAEVGRAFERMAVALRDAAAEREAREAQLRRAERLTSLATLVGGVAHELNNPLSAISNFTEVMLLDDRSAEDREAIEIVGREAARAARIVADLRALARDTRDERRAREPVALADVVRHVLRLRQYALQTRSIRLEEHLPDAPLHVVGDRGALEQVLVNLVVNAEQALGGWSGERALVVRAERSGDRARLVVQDSGPGIAAEHLPFVFDAFWTTKAPGEGTGLGLSLVHSIVRDHGGEVRVESTSGGGASFVVELPAAAAPAPSPTPGESPVRAVRRVLVVDDEASIRRSLARFLGARGHVVELATSGREAVGMLDAAATPYDIVLADLRMPDGGGEEVLRRLRSGGHVARTRFVFVTGDAVSPDAARIVRESSVPVVLKPFALGQIAALVEQPAPLVAA